MSESPQKTAHKLSDAEWLVIQTIRAEGMTGYWVHETDSGKFYIWSMGAQPDKPLTGVNPITAARKFLKLFHKGRKSEYGNNCKQPSRRRGKS